MSSGMQGVALALAERLKERVRSRAGNVVGLDEARARRGLT